MHVHFHTIAHVHVHFQYTCRRVSCNILQIQFLGCNCRYLAAIADVCLQLQMLSCNCRCSAAIADAQLQLQNYSVAIADCKYTLQALRPRGVRSQKQLSCNCRLQMHSAGPPPMRGSEQSSSVAIADCKYTLQAPHPGRGSSQDSSVAIADCKYTLQAPHPGGGLSRI